MASVSGLLFPEGGQILSIFFHEGLDTLVVQCLQHAGGHSEANMPVLVGDKDLLGDQVHLELTLRLSIGVGYGVSRSCLLAGYLTSSRHNRSQNPLQSETVKQKKVFPHRIEILLSIVPDRSAITP